jgi:cytochrome c oxidase subunit II
VVPVQQHSVLHPAGPQAARIVVLWHQLATTATIVFILVVAATLYAVLHRRRDPDDRFTDDRRAGRAIITAIGATVTVLLLFVCASVWADRSVRTPTGVPPLHVHVTGHQWWWQVDYVDSVPQHRLTTANEIHVPTGRPVLLELTSDDVIHSFWVPNVDGKLDLVPGHTNWLTFQVDTPGVYRGTCAEFCGRQHANMAMLLVAERPDQFAHWVAQQMDTAPAPADSLDRAGELLFTGSGCALCHTVRGTPAQGSLGPDLTHVGGRGLIAAGALTNTPDHLAAWIRDASALKPGTLMPPTRISDADLRALVTWLEHLQ